jgi:hypothetical protein
MRATLDIGSVAGPQLPSDSYTSFWIVILDINNTMRLFSYFAEQKYKRGKCHCQDVVSGKDCTSWSRKIKHAV